MKEDIGQLACFAVLQLDKVIAEGSDTASIAVDAIAAYTIALIAERFGLEEKTTIKPHVKVGDRVRYLPTGKEGVCGALEHGVMSMRYDHGWINSVSSNFALCDSVSAPSPLTDEELAKAIRSAWLGAGSTHLWEDLGEQLRIDWLNASATARRLLDDAKDDTIRRLFAERAEAIQNARKDERERCVQAVLRSRNTMIETACAVSIECERARAFAVGAIRALDSSDAIMQDGNNQ